jgi:hypothetical protein
MTHTKTPATSATPAARLARRVANRLASDAKESGVALLSAILFMIIMAGIGTVIVGTVLGQVHPTYLDQKDTQTVYSAQAGMQAALSRFRAATLTNSSGVQQTDTLGNPLGDPTKLPCSLSGSVDPTTPANGVTYSVAIHYYSFDPTYLTTAAVPVPPGELPFSDTGGVTSTLTAPVKYALVLSGGVGNLLPGAPATSTAGNRSLGAVYQFKVSTVNIVGGLINDYNSGGAFCLSAITAAAGSTIQFLPATSCTAANKVLDLWIYDTDYEIKLASSTANGAAGLCITGPATKTATTTQNAVLQACATDATRWNQLWDWQGGNTWVGVKSDISGDSGYTLGTGYAAGSDLTNKPLLVENGGTNGGFSPSAAVGAGDAGYATNEIVNYLEFGRCMDDTGESPTATHMISYPCKQNPAGGGVKWNQRFYYTEPPVQAAGTGDTWPAPPVPATGTQTLQQIVVKDDAGLSASPPTPIVDYCLTWASSATKPTVGALVVLKACPGSTTYKNWLRVYNTGDYDSSYTFTTPGLTAAGAATTLCLEVNPAITDTGWSELDLALCTGSLGQKWNAPPAYVASEVGGYKEIGG